MTTTVLGLRARRILLRLAVRHEKIVAQIITLYSKEKNVAKFMLLNGFKSTNLQLLFY